jgi:hypothetical protein
MNHKDDGRRGRLLREMRLREAMLQDVERDTRFLKRLRVAMIKRSAEKRRLLALMNLAPSK